MSHHPLRSDKTCLNCNHVVEKRFCGNCGQENTDTRKTFYELFVHFFEDLTHYENSFWKTIRNLIFKPAALTKEYLSGKRMSYLAPIRLYIFISFVTFFTVSILPDESEDDDVTITEKNTSNKKTDDVTLKKDSLRQTYFIKNLENRGLISKKEADSLEIAMAETRKKQRNNNQQFNFGYSSIEKMDSIQKYGKEEDKINDFVYWLNKKIILAQKGKTPEEVKEKFFEAFVKNIPKTLFIYMPLFAFVLWVFQSKKRWYYFDHGIFTLHYFSFLLLATLIFELVNYFLGFLDQYWIIDLLLGIINTVIIIYMFYYFFPAHHRFYGQSRLKTILKGILIFFINMFILLLILLGIAAYSFINIH